MRIANFLELQQKINDLLVFRQPLFGCQIQRRFNK